jgi:protein phosphatase
MKIAFAALTDTGLVRQNNEDNYVVCDVGRGTSYSPPPVSGEGTAETNRRGVLLAVADGMGGALAGEVASRMAVEALSEAARDLREEADDESARNTVLEAIRRANESIYEASASNPQQRGMGTTLTAALLRDGRIQFFQVGDSKGFIGREGQLHQMTEDQSLIGKLIHDKVITPEDAEQLEGGRNIILQALGAEPTVKIDVSTSTLQEGDYVLLCTDGWSTRPPTAASCARTWCARPATAGAPTTSRSSRCRSSRVTTGSVHRASSDASPACSSDKSRSE